MTSSFVCFALFVVVYGFLCGFFVFVLFVFCFFVCLFVCFLLLVVVFWVGCE